MTAGVESVDAIAWAGALLSADSAFLAACPGGWHLGVGPQGIASPVAALWVQSAPELLSFNGVHIWTDATLMVKISAQQDNFASVRTAAVRSMALLNRAHGGAQGATIISSVFIQGFPLPERQLINGVQWISYVQLFRVYVQ
jgi:hypothetical protein